MRPSHRSFKPAAAAGLIAVTTLVYISYSSHETSDSPVQTLPAEGKFLSYYDYSQTGKHHAYRSEADKEPPEVKIPDRETPLSNRERELVAAQDGRYLVNNSKERFPYHRFSIEVGNDPLPGAEAVWSGHSLPDRLVTMYGWDYTAQSWLEMDAGRGEVDFVLKGKLDPASMVRNGKVDILIQDRIPAEGEYDFGFVWMTDTQYYSESFPHIYDTMTKWLVDNWKKHKFSYLIHTGDIVNNWNRQIEWERASASMKRLDDAQIPYGVVAGNHDVNYDAGMYKEYWKYFGRNRFEKQPVYGGDLNNNRDHYDLVSVKGNDFVILYLGWLIDKNSFKWAHSVLNRYADRNAIIATHEYLKPNKAYYGQGKAIWDNLVVPHSNVFLVLGGHNPGVALNTKTIGDRKVYEMLVDYQNGPEGGQGFMRFLQFDLEHKRLFVSTYSPYLNKWNYFKKEDDEFVLPLTLKPVEKQVATDYIGLYVK